MPNTPDERGITLTQLWERDYMFLDTMNKATATFKEELDQTVIRLNDVFNQKIKEAIQTVELKNQEIKDVQAAMIKSFEKASNDTYTKLVKGIQEQDLKLDSAFSYFRKELTEKTGSEIQKSYEQIFAGISDISKNVTKYKNDVSEEVSKAKQEISFKVGQVTALFNESKQKFKKVAEQLQ